MSDNTAAYQLAGTALSVAGEAYASKKANQRAVQWWERQNEYNHPTQARKRLQEAGLNPNLVYGNGVSGASGSAGDIGRPDKLDTSKAGEGLERVMNAKQRKAQTDLLQQQIETEAERKRLVANQADSAFYDAANKNFSDLTNPIVQNTLDGMKWKNENLRIDSQLKTIDREIKDTTKAQKVKDIFWRAEQAQKNYEGRQLQNQLLQLQKEYLGMGLDRNAPWYAKLLMSLIQKTGVKL